VCAALATPHRKALAEREALRGRRRKAVLIKIPWQLLGQPLLIRPHGGGNAQWRWLLTCPDANFDLGLGEVNDICCRVRHFSELLWCLGYRWAWHAVRTVIEGRSGARYSSIAASSPPGTSATPSCWTSPRLER
jgi:hypothetical protein